MIMNQAKQVSGQALIPRQRSGPVVRIIVDNVNELDQVVAAAARYAHHLGVPLELVEPSTASVSHAARAHAIALIDQALLVARRAAPGLDIRIGIVT